MAIICVKDAHWVALACTMGQPGLGHDPRYATNRERAKRIDEVDRLIGEWSSTLGKEEVFRLSQVHRFPAAPVRDLHELSEDPHLHARGALQRVEHPVLGSIVLPHSPIRMAHLPLKPLTANPGLGEHSESVLRELLQLPDEELQRYAHDVGFGPADAKEDACERP